MADSFLVLMILAAYSCPEDFFTHLRTTENAPLGRENRAAQSPAAAATSRPRWEFNLRQSLPERQEAPGAAAGRKRHIGAHVHPQTQREAGPGVLLPAKDGGLWGSGGVTALAHVCRAVAQDAAPTSITCWGGGGGGSVHGREGGGGGGGGVHRCAFRCGGCGTRRPPPRVAGGGGGGGGIGKLLEDV